MRFATRWDLLYAFVLVGYDPMRQQYYARPGEAGAPLLCMWTNSQSASASVPDRFRVVSTEVRPRLAELPSGVGIVLDPGTPNALVIDPEYAEVLKRYAHPFPRDANLIFEPWTSLPAETVRSIASAAASYAFVGAVWALRYTIDDSPFLGCLVYETSGGAEAKESVADALVKALESVSGPQDLGVLGVEVVSVVDTPGDVALDLYCQPPLYAAGS